MSEPKPKHPEEEMAAANARLREELAERQRAERERGESERRYQALMEAAPDPILIHAAGRCVFANRQAAMLLGAPSPDALLGRPVLELIHPDDRPAAVERIALAGAGTQTPRRDFRYLRLDGTAVDVEVSGTRVEFGGQPAILIFIRDITERKRAEAALRQSRADLNRAQAVARTGSWRIDVAGQRLLWSDETYRMFRIPQGMPLTYQTFLAAVHPDDRVAVEAAWQATLKGAPYDIEHRILVDGEVKWVRERAELERDAAGNLVGGFGTVQDITERKEAEAERHRTALFPEQNPSPVLRIAHEGTLLYANPASGPLLTAWGCEVGGLLSAAAEAAVIHPVLLYDKTEVEVTCGDRVYSLVHVPFEAEGYINVYGRDITERKRAEDALAASQRLLHSILEQAPDGMNVRDRQGCVMFVNRVSRRRALRPPEGTPLDMAPEVWGEFLNADGTPVPVDEWPAARALRGETATREFLRRTPTGSLCVLNSASPLRNDKGEIIGAVSSTTDISERKRMEDQLREALAERERALADNVTLLREVHHRVKNNLQMLCDLLYLQMEGLADAEKAEVLRDTYGRIYAIARLHEQLYQAMQSGEVQLGTYLARLVGGFESLYPAMRVQMEIGDDQVHLDLDRAIHVGLVVNELVTNALKHAFADRAPGEVTVRLHRINETVEVQVRDTGKGLPPDLDLDQTKTLGLRIVRILAQRLGATVKIENERGAAFTVHFPLHAEAPVEPRHE